MTSTKSALAQATKRSNVSVLYHYTSLEGLKGILTCETVWASHIYYLNDSQEFNYAVMLVESLIRGRETRGTRASKRICARLREALQALEPVPVCVFSLSEHADQLSQWRGYSRIGAGYSIGFSKKFFDGTLGRTGKGLVPCVYKQRPQKLILSKVLNNLCDYYRDKPEDDKLNSHFSEYLAKVAPQIKDPGFSEEREWRIILEPDGQPLRYRAGKTMLIPYRLIGLGQGAFSEPPIKEIIVGPTAHKELASSSLKGLLKRKNIDCAVRTSDIPFRSI